MQHVKTMQMENITLQPRDYERIICRSVFAHTYVNNFKYIYCCKFYIFSCSALSNNPLPIICVIGQTLPAPSLSCQHACALVSS